MVLDSLPERIEVRRIRRGVEQAVGDRYMWGLHLRLRVCLYDLRVRDFCLSVHLCRRYLLCVFVIEAAVVILSEIFPEHSTQRFGYTGDSAAMNKFHCGLPVRVGTYFGGSLHHPVEVLKRIVNRNTVRKCARLDKVSLPLGEGPGCGVLLQDDEIAADLRSGVVDEKVIG